MLSTVILCAAVGQLSAPPIFPAEDAPPPPPPPSLSDAPRSAFLVPRVKPTVTAGQLVGRSVLSPLIAFGVGVLTVPLSIYLGALVGVVIDPRQGESVGGGVGAIVGGALGYLVGTAIASTLFERDPTAFRRAIPWAITASLLSTLGMCLVFFVPAVGIAALPFVVAGAVVLAAAVPLVTEAVRPKEPEGVTVATF
ncbi:MAG: hypothetical protein Q8S33_35395 [Myxococcales bacterium]|nr:hypothetical protein [Myxococcales bacterium]MDP3505682.1 hypothetical protein [Myxococcales bacterium]